MPASRHSGRSRSHDPAKGPRLHLRGSQEKGAQVNVPLLRRIQRQIDKAPDKFAMTEVSQETSCGTAFCIAGWTKALSGFKKTYIRPSGISELRCSDGAMELLEITFEQSLALFYTHNWPVEFRVEDGNPTLPAKAIARIEHFIKTEGRE